MRVSLDELTWPQIGSSSERPEMVPTSPVGVRAAQFSSTAESRAKTGARLLRGSLETRRNVAGKGSWRGLSSWPRAL